MPRDVATTDADIPPERRTALSHALSVLGTATTADIEQMSLAERERAANTFWTWWMLASPGAAKPPRSGVLLALRDGRGRS